MRIAPGRMRGGPVSKDLDLGGGQRWIVRKLPDVRIGKPGRHLLRASDLCDCARVSARLFVGLERHGRHFTRAVAALAMRLQQRKNVAVKGRWCGSSPTRQSREQENEEVLQGDFFIVLFCSRSPLQTGPTGFAALFHRRVTFFEVFTR